MVVLGHRRGDLAERRVGRHQVDVARHRILDCDLGRVHVAQRFDEEGVALREDPNELAALEDGQMPDPPPAHLLVRQG